MKPILCALQVLFLALSASAATRHYYIAAEDVAWDYAPSGYDLLHGRAIPPPWHGHTRWLKTRYIEYTDATFTVRKPQPAWLGILGPIIRAEVGDTIVVEFLNRSKLPHSMHPHGLRYDKDDEGAMYMPSGRGASVDSGDRFTYRWHANTGSGPGPGQLSSTVWWYHSHTDEPSETNAGLLGPIIVTAKGKARPDGSPKDVDQEFVAAYMIFDEMRGQDAGLFHAINGYVFGNLPGLVMKQGEHVRWYLMGMGNERDLHTPHWHGETLTDGHRNADVVELLPASTVTMDMNADNPGTWLFHCQVTDHMEAGMMSEYTIYQPEGRCPLSFPHAALWGDSSSSVTVRNNSAKTITRMQVEFDRLITPQFRMRPVDYSKTWEIRLAPGQQATLPAPESLARQSQGIEAWAVFPLAIVYSDGTSWKPAADGQCFQAFWRGKDHPQLEVLPPLQLDMEQD